MSASTPVSSDRAVRIKRALLEMVAEEGFGASMASVARRASVATGTAYVHFRSKDELVLATYLDAKEAMSDAAVADINPEAPPRERFLKLWRNVFEFLAADPAVPRFLVQVDASPFADAAFAAASSRETRLTQQASAPDLAGLLIPLPQRLIYDLTLGVAVRLAAGGRTLEEAEKESVARACWRAVTNGD